MLFQYLVHSIIMKLKDQEILESCSIFVALVCFCFICFFKFFFSCYKEGQYYYYVAVDLKWKVNLTIRFFDPLGESYVIFKKKARKWLFCDNIGGVWLLQSRSILLMFLPCRCCYFSTLYLPPPTCTHTHTSFICVYSISYMFFFLSTVYMSGMGRFM